MKEEKFLKELKDKGFHYSKPECATHYGKELCLKTLSLAYVKDKKVTTAKMTYWLHSSDSLDKYIVGIELEGFIGPGAEAAAAAFTDAVL